MYPDIYKNKFFNVHMYICVCFIPNQYNTSNAIQQGFVKPNIQQKHVRLASGRYAPYWNALYFI